MLNTYVCAACCMRQQECSLLVSVSVCVCTPHCVCVHDMQYISHALLPECTANAGLPATRCRDGTGRLHAHPVVTASGCQMLLIPSLNMTPHQGQRALCKYGEAQRPASSSKAWALWTQQLWCAHPTHTAMLLTSGLGRLQQPFSSRAMPHEPDHQWHCLPCSIIPGPHWSNRPHRCI